MCRDNVKLGQRALQGRGRASRRMESGSRRRDRTVSAHRRRAPRAGAVVLLATIASLLVTAAPASAQTNGFGCRAEAVNLKLFGQPPIRPLVAGSDRVCADDDGGLP